MSNALTTTNDKLSFWKRPEGQTGKLLMWAAIAAAGFGFVHFLPAIIALAENVIYLGVLIGVIATAFFVVTAERPRTLMFYAFQMICRAITSNFVDIDPIAILKSFARQMRKKKEEVEKSIARILGVKRTLDDEIARSDKEMRRAVQLAQVAQEAGDEDSLNVQAEKAGRRDSNIAEYKSMQSVVSEILDALTRVKKRVDYHIANSEDEMNELIRKNEIALATKDATRSASAVLGDSDMLEVRNMAADRIRERYSSAMGELDGLIQMSHNLDSEIDLNQLAFRQDGKAKLAQLRSKLSQVEGGSSQKALGAGAPSSFVPASSGQSENVWAKRLKGSQN